MVANVMEGQDYSSYRRTHLFFFSFIIFSALECTSNLENQFYLAFVFQPATLTFGHMYRNDVATLQLALYSMRACAKNVCRIPWGCNFIVTGVGWSSLCLQRDENWVRLANDNVAVCVWHNILQRCGMLDNHHHFNNEHRNHLKLTMIFFVLCVQRALELTLIGFYCLISGHCI